jgi:hypothetical protein
MSTFEENSAGDTMTRNHRHARNPRQRNRSVRGIGFLTVATGNSLYRRVMHLGYAWQASKAVDPSCAFC